MILCDTNIPLYTYNLKDFNFMPNINIHKV